MRLFVGNLPYAMTDAEVEQQMAKFGEVVDVRILCTPEGTSRGFGFVKMKKASAGVAAIRAGGFEYMGRSCYIRKAEPVARTMCLTDEVRPGAVRAEGGNYRDARTHRALDGRRVPAGPARGQRDFVDRRAAIPAQ